MRDLIPRAILLLAPVVCANAITLNQLSPEARELLADLTERIAVQLHDGTVHVGEVVDETDTEISLRTSARGITATRRIAIDSIARRREYDVTPVLAERLAGMELHPEQSLDPHAYRRAIRLLLEFIDKAEPSETVATLRLNCLEFMREYTKLRQGLEKLDGEWLTPVNAAVVRFDKLGATLDRLRHDREYAVDEGLRARHRELLAKRREIARHLPRLTRERVELLLRQTDIHGAAAEVNAFLQFWIKRVAGQEAEETVGMAEMDFNFLLQLQQRVVDAWWNGPGRGLTKPAGLRVPDGMVFIPGGFFLMGNSKAAPEEATFPAHLVWVDPFLIDRHAASNAEYREFLAHIEKTREAWMQHPDAPPLKDHTPATWNTTLLTGERQPVAGIDWFDAYAYVTWRSKRLPTEAEWEFAARGHDGRAYPWGDSLQSAVVNYPGGRAFIEKEMERQNPPVAHPTGGGCGCVRRRLPPPEPVRIPESTWAVDAHLPDVAARAVADGFLVWDQTFLSPFGLYHMAGNVAEWTGDWFDADYYGYSPYRNPTGPASGSRRVFRGGHYQSNPGELAGWSRGPTLAPQRRRSARVSEPPIINVGVRGVQPLDDLPVIPGQTKPPDDLSFDQLRDALRNTLEEPKATEK